MSPWKCYGAGHETICALAELFDSIAPDATPAFNARPVSRQIVAQNPCSIFTPINRACITRSKASPHARRFPTRSQCFQNSRLRHKSADRPDGPQPVTSAFVALGSNVGDRLSNIENACRLIDQDDDMLVTQTSALYETAPMYVEDQDSFLNAACEVHTTLKPIQLLDKLQAIEKQLGRVKIIDKGPRSVDLDIILYGEHEVSTERLTIPHALVKEREFVLRPLSDMPTSRQRRLDSTFELRVVDYLERVADDSAPMLSVTPLTNQGLNLRPQDPSRRTQVMSILNVTPDSFSDGGKHRTSDMSSLLSMLKTQIAAGVKMIDIGGQSSRPCAANISAEEEISRVVPVIEEFREHAEAAGVAISVDTYRAAVADAAVRAGAHIINDISAGLLDPEMLPTIGRLGCTYVMMHMRGTPSTMQSAENCSYPNGLLPTVADELSQRIEAAQHAGVRRWRIILDPGIGFAKTVDQNLEILRNFEGLRADPRLTNIPWLLGSSRKSFIGMITGKEKAAQRDWGTAATVTAAICGGADIVRVHDPESMFDVAFGGQTADSAPCIINLLLHNLELKKQSVPKVRVDSIRMS